MALLSRKINRFLKWYGLFPICRFVKWLRCGTIFPVLPLCDQSANPQTVRMRNGKTRVLDRAVSPRKPICCPCRIFSPSGPSLVETIALPQIASYDRICESQYAHTNPVYGFFFSPPARNHHYKFIEENLFPSCAVRERLDRSIDAENFLLREIRKAIRNPCF